MLDNNRFIVKPGCKSNLRYFIQLLNLKNQEHLKTIELRMKSKYTLNDVVNSNTSISQSSAQVFPVFSPISQNKTATIITCKLTRSMSGTFSSNVNFMAAQFLRRVGKLSILQDIERNHEHDESRRSLELPKHHKRRHKKAASLYNHSQGFTDNLI
ncbi:unnamed protein product [Adineta steineri]|uniref:Uncharacterized protein n=1 Tax=Adineta steineri TaxID=433720 RepID=A0A816DYQ6_9BILA|nr:unnamed protein product [Adineta steineri]CAF1640511.1 unnamed protein product [Adineta steineri]